MISKKMDIENLFVYLLSFVIFIPHFVIVSEGTSFTTFAPRAYSISLIIFIFSIPFFIYFFKKEQFLITNLSKIIFLYIIIYLTSTIFSENFYNSFFGWLYRNKSFLIIITILFLVIISPLILNNINKIKKLINIGIFFSSIYSIYGILQFFNLDPFYFVSSKGERVFSFFINPNYFTPIILIFVYLSLNKIILEKNKLYLIPFILNLTAILFAQTFTTFLALFITFPIYIFLIIKFFPQNKKGLLKFLLILIIILIIFSIFFVFLINKYNPYLFKRYTYLTTLKTRIYLWRDLINMVKNEFGIKEYLIGIGGENLNRKFMPYKSIELEKLEPNSLYDNSHNEYIDQFIKGGFFQLIGYLLIIIYSLLFLYKTVKNYNDDVKIISFSVFISLLAYSINLSGTYETIQMFLFLILLLLISNSIFSIIYENKYKFLKNKFILLLFLTISIVNFSYHHFLNQSVKYANIGYSSLSFYNYIKNIDREKSLKSLSDSEEYFNKSLIFNPFEKSFFPYYLAKIYFYYGVEYNDISYNLKSIQKLNECLDKTQYPDAVYNMLGDNYYILGDTNKAIDCYKKSIEWYKFFDEPILSLTKIYINKNDLDEAEKYVDIILSVKENPIAYRYKGIIYLMKDNKELAKKYLKRAVDLGDKESIEILKNIDL
jgi:tetratricopeptide (TPR) repeat protein